LERGVDFMVVFVAAVCCTAELWCGREGIPFLISMKMKPFTCSFVADSRIYGMV